jgi:hypothetical protein
MIVRKFQKIRGVMEVGKKNLVVEIKLPFVISTTLRGEIFFHPALKGRNIIAQAAGLGMCKEKVLTSPEGA